LMDSNVKEDWERAAMQTNSRVARSRDLM
jgi:hypothetical protein